MADAATERPVLLLTTVDVGNGQQETIRVCEGDHPEVRGDYPGYPGCPVYL